MVRSMRRALVIPRRLHRRIGVLGALLVLLGAGLGATAHALLANDDRALDSAAATATFRGGGIQVQHPADWEQLAAGPAVQDGPAVETLLDLRSPDSAEQMTLARTTTPTDLRAVCASVVEHARDQGVASDGIERLADIEVDGRTAEHHRTRGSDHAGQVAVDMYCIPQEGHTYLLIAQHTHPSAARPVPAAPALVDSWRWTGP
ncbi:MAG: hypothetical protein Q4G40_07095 [Brachybacterium sp.]|nr:hypothetical protein [Brachybacterium sp.]